MKEKHEMDWKRDYEGLVTLASGELVGLRAFMFTVGLCVGLQDDGYRIRYCYPSWAAAEAALAVWDGSGDPSGPWIKAKGAGIDRPNTLKGIPIVTQT